MRAVIIDSPKKMRIGEIPRPTPKENEVLVKIGAAGVCAGDLHIYTGKSPYATYPCVGGHEMAGTIDQLGSSVDRFSIGQRVVIDPFVGCGKCYPCRIGKYNCCVNLHILGVHSQGGFAEYLCVPTSKLHLVPDNLPLQIAAFAEPIAIGIQACNRAGVTSKDTVLVLGCGPIGMVTIEVAINRGARVLASDINEQRLLIASQMGAETVVSDSRILEKILGLTGNEGAAVVIEATGVPAVMEKTVELVAAGGRIVIVGLVPSGVGVTFPGLDFTRKELTILGSRTNKNCFPEALDLLSSKKIIFPDLARSFSLWDSPELFNRLAENPGLYHKAVLLNN
jgi:L-gulonate 5-dehydrogenase